MSTHDKEVMVAGYTTSPRPRRQPLTPLLRNQRSYSRLSSKGIFGDDSPLLLSPLPRYPNRRRSVTFADEAETTVREERPYYTMNDLETPTKEHETYSSRKWQWDNGAGKPLAEQGECPDSYGNTSRAPVSRPVTPLRSRSVSRQRRIARRQEAQLHHSFYEDSMVEEYVLKVRKEIEEEEQRMLEDRMRIQENEKREAEKRVVQATVKMNALQQAKEFLMSSARACCVSPVNAGSGASGSDEAPTAPVCGLGKGASAARQSLDASAAVVDEDSVVSIRMRPKTTSCSVPLVTMTEDGADTNESRKRVREKPQAVQESSLSIVKGGADSSEDEGSNMRRQKSRLESIISRIIEQRRNGPRGKHSVVVIDWDSMDSQEVSVLPSRDTERAGAHGGADDTLGVVGAGGAACDVTVPLERRSAPRAPKSVARKAVPHLSAPPERRPASACRGASRCASSAKGVNANARLPSETVEFFPLEDEDQPILLRRPKRKEIVATRSISNISSDVDVTLPQAPVSVSTSLRRAPRRKQNSSKQAVPLANPSDCLASAAYDPFIEDESQFTPHEVTAAKPSARSQRKVTSSRQRQVPIMSPNDPMSVFFSADFPSPSKFDEMMLAAGAAPDGRRVQGGNRRGPTLLLPTSIARNR
ncbi:hypothetical protein ERJ75_000212000 [Trypanosoma vivax]|uniref:Uncharacterized protein n=1 Tax=Trypanosoma vivax (strain Y486) TaxID=1055687 RepID=G0U9X6_TRYVY|nr:hypothetical protein TRVL_02360 [Trypanosoma vivax]KAH8619124.1 hypothetical protein ERJ75_000212000 [Trypanosoma vivax]CCC52607.1 conserved hypothetical protein [Trypanosoma vivax Y486]